MFVEQPGNSGQPEAMCDFLVCSCEVGKANVHFLMRFCHALTHTDQLLLLFTAFLIALRVRFFSSGPAKADFGDPRSV